MWIFVCMLACCHVLLGQRHDFQINHTFLVGQDRDQQRNKAEPVALGRRGKQSGSCGKLEWGFITVPLLPLEFPQPREHLYERSNLIL